jgi:hypothetical protein
MTANKKHENSPLLLVTSIKREGESERSVIWFYYCAQFFSCYSTSHRLRSHIHTHTRASEIQQFKSGCEGKKLKLHEEKKNSHKSGDA